MSVIKLNIKHSILFPSLIKQFLKLILFSPHKKELVMNASVCVIELKVQNFVISQYLLHNC